VKLGHYNVLDDQGSLFHKDGYVVESEGLVRFIQVMIRTIRLVETPKKAVGAFELDALWKLPIVFIPRA
jgi:hypothetical protein